MELLANDVADILNALVLSGSTTVAVHPYNALFLHLYASDTISITRQTTQDELEAVEADYSGYSAGAVTWLAPSISDDGTVEVIGTIPEFRPTATTIGNTIYGAWGQRAGADSIAFAAALDAEAPMYATTDSLLLTIRLRVPSGGLAVEIS